MNTFKNKIILAPMEGVLDALMRDLLTSINPYDLCITEFVRVVDQLVPVHIFHKVCPELKSNALTPSGTPIRTQLLGQNPDWMAENALRAIELGSNGVDINFGCPANTVNKSKGGAVLLKEPEKLYQIISKVRSALGSKEQLSVKIRLGFENTNLFTEIIDAISSSKPNVLSIHARTKKQGYKAPAHWHHISEAVEQLKRTNSEIDVIANGEIWTREDAQKCREVANTSNIMLGRGALASPNLAYSIKQDLPRMNWLMLSELLIKYSESELQGDKSFYFSSRLKQWLRYIRLQYPQGEVLFQAIKLLKNKNEILSEIKRISHN